MLLLLLVHRQRPRQRQATRDNGDSGSTVERSLLGSMDYMYTLYNMVQATTRANVTRITMPLLELPGVWQRAQSTQTLAASGTLVARARARIDFACNMGCCWFRLYNDGRARTFAHSRAHHARGATHGTRT